MRRLFSAIDRLGNLPPLAAVFPDADVPIVRLGGDGRRELVSARWGWARTDRGWVTNARNLERSWGVLRNVGQRCLVPATAFAEYHPTATIPGVRGRPIKAATWFRLAGTTDRPPFAFPGFWRPWDWRIDGLRRASDRDLAASSAATQRGGPADPSEGDAGRPPYRSAVRDVADRRCRQRGGAPATAPGFRTGNRLHRCQGR